MGGLTGDLRPKVCGAHLKRDYRLAFTMRPPDREDIEGIVDILFMGRRDTRDRTQDVWQIVHDLFGVENPPADHVRPPCCDSGMPVLDEQELADFMAASAARKRKASRHGWHIDQTPTTTLIRRSAGGGEQTKHVVRVAIHPDNPEERVGEPDSDPLPLWPVRKHFA